jgi:hypothetical protein
LNFVLVFGRVIKRSVFDLSRSESIREVCVLYLRDAPEKVRVGLQVARFEQLYQRH